MKRFVVLTVALALGLSLAACSNEKGAATTAITAAEAAFAAVRDNGMKIMPTETKAVEDAIAAAKSTLSGGDAKAALAAANAIPAQITALSDAIPAKTTELTSAWNALSAGLPGVMETIQSRVAMLAKSAKLPSGMDKAAFEAVQSGVSAAGQSWTEAQSAFQAGNLADAVSKADAVKQACASALTALKMPVPAALQ